MKIIDKIEIKHFRSFLGTPKSYEVNIESLANLNIFSGANDSGKSNILRALNLFFNDEISSKVPLEFERDFFMSDKSSSHKVIEIGISFDLSKDKKRDKFLPEKFKISKFYDRNGFRNYLYTFLLKGKEGEIKIDSRSENNEKIKDLFLLKNSSEKDRENAEKREWNYRVKFSGFLNKSISFEYVPAIRDTNFFAQLFGRVITRIKNNEDQKIENYEREKNKIINWEKTLKNTTEKSEFKDNLKTKKWREDRLNEIETLKKKESKLTTAIKNLEEEINKYSTNLISSVNFLDSEFKIGKNLRDFFEGFDVGTGVNRAVSLKLRGDGIQAKFVPKILDFLSTIDSEKKYFLWGFEEPENSAEYKNQQELAGDFKNSFLKNKQIFVTTHSEEFLQLYDGSEIEKEKRVANLYHVKKITNKTYGEYSQVFLFDVDKNEFEFANQKVFLEDDLGQSHLRAKYSKEIKKREDEFLEDRTKVQKENIELRNVIEKSTKPLVFVEDTYDQIYKIAWLKLFEKEHSKSNFDEIFSRECKFLIFKAEGASNLAGFLRQKNIDYFSNKKVIGLFDFDEQGRKQFKCLKNETYWNLGPINDKKTGTYKKRNDHELFCALLIPIPEHLENLADLDFPSFVEIENLLPHKFLLDNGFASESKTTGNTVFIRIKEEKKSKIWEKLFDLPKDDFVHFAPLFKIINELFVI